MTPRIDPGEVTKGFALFEHLDLMALLTAAGPVLIALIGGWYAYRAASAKAGTDAASSVQTGFQMLIKELQTENVKLIDRLERQATKMDEQVVKMGELEDRVRGLIRHVDKLESAMIKAGVDVPPMPNR